MPKESVLDIKFLYSPEELTFLKSHLLKNYMISVPHVKEEQYTLVLEFYLDQNGLFTLDKAFVNEVYLEDKTITVGTTGGQTPTTQTKEGETTPQTTTPTPEVKQEQKIEKVKKERKTNCIIKLVNCTYGINPSLMTSLIEKETKQENEDLNLKYVKDKRNELETFMYTTKENLTSSLKGFADDKEVETLLGLMNKTEDWIYHNLEETYVKQKNC